MTVLSVDSVGPHDFPLCLRVSRSFSPERIKNLETYRFAVRVDDRPAVIEISQLQKSPAVFQAKTALRGKRSEIARVAGWVIFAELNLGNFYEVAGNHPVMGQITKKLYGLKPMRPPSLFEMLVIAVTEQQISMAAAYHIRRRIIERFGDNIDGVWAFPTARRISEFSLDELKACGLSQRKAEYVHALAYRVAAGLLNLERLETLPDDEVREIIVSERGFGPWSADYFLVRGLSRPDAFPALDLGIRTVVGRYLGDGGRLSPQETLEKLLPFKPYRGLAAFYLLAYDRLARMTLPQ